MTKRDPIGPVDMFAAECKPYKGKAKKLPGVSGNYAGLPTKRTRPRRVKAGAVILPRILSFPSDTPTKPFWYLPRTAAAYDAMVEQMALGICRDAGFAELTRKYAIDALSAIGIRRPAK